MNETLTIRETTQQRVAGHLLGVGNIWERELADAGGKVAPRMSASLSIFAPESGSTREQKVFAGKVIAVGGESWCVEEVEEGVSAPGSLTLMRLAR